MRDLKPVTHIFEEKRECFWVIFKNHTFMTKKNIDLLKLINPWATFNVYRTQKFFYILLSRLLVEDSKSQSAQCKNINAFYVVHGFYRLFRDGNMELELNF